MHEPLLHHSFPDDFVLGTSSSAYQVLTNSRSQYYNKFFVSNLMFFHLWYTVWRWNKQTWKRTCYLGYSYWEIYRCVCVCVCECLSICQKKIMINIYMRSYESIWKYFKPLNLDRLDHILPFIYKFQCAFSLDKLTIYYPSPFLLIKHLDGW